MLSVSVRRATGDPYHSLARVTRNRGQLGSALPHHRAQQRLGIGQPDTGAPFGEPFDGDVAREQQSDDGSAEIALNASGGLQAPRMT